MRVLGINQGHNGSAAYVVDGELKFYIEEERLSRQKYDGNPFRGMLEAIKEGVDTLIIGGTSSNNPKLPWTGEDPYTALVRKFNPKVKIISAGEQHHKGHAATAFYNSGFETAIAIVIDGSGSHHTYSSEEGGNEVSGFETETVFSCEYPSKFEPLHKQYGTNDPMGHVSDDMEIKSGVTIVKSYEAVTNWLGFHFIEAGKTMGLSAYGGPDESLPDFFTEGKSNKNVFIPSYPSGAYISPDVMQKNDHSHQCQEESTCTTEFTDLEKNAAWKIQNDTQELVGDLIEKVLSETDEKNVVLSGGYGLNCVANYYFKERFPDINLYVDPTSHDGGTSIGIAKMVHYKETEDTTIRPLKSLYLGVTTETYDNLEEIEGIKVSDTSYQEVAEHLANRKIVAIFQGRSEAGPRALGNRSILYDPTDVDGKSRVNKVKGREWFRPFAGTILKEHFDEWFETRCLEESPFMMYAMNLDESKHGEVPAITHNDGSCRIQTVDKEQNEHFYNLISEFNKIKDIPILFNTSFNLAGEPLVETLEDGIETLKKSEIDFLYLPECNKIINIIK